VMQVTAAIPPACQNETVRKGVIYANRSCFIDSK
jgi:hypothetical protein